MNKPFSKLSVIESPSRLETAVFERIRHEQKKAYVRKAFGFGFLGLSSVGASTVSFTYAFINLKASGVLEYISFIFTDGSTAFSYSKELALSVLEALPALSLAIAIFTAFMLAWSATRFIRVSKALTQYA